jgi:hypothetical protein
MDENPYRSPVVHPLVKKERQRICRARFAAGTVFLISFGWMFGGLLIFWFALQLVRINVVDFQVLSAILELLGATTPAAVVAAITSLVLFVSLSIGAKRREEFRTPLVPHEAD